MQSVKSCFNGALFRKNLARFWPVWALYTLCWFFVLVLPPLLANFRWEFLDANRLPLQLIGTAGLLSAVVFPVLCAMCVFSYLYSSRPVGMLHALPIRREGLFLTNYLSGLSFLILPNIALFLLALGAQAMAGAGCVGALCMWLAAQSLMCLFFYSFAVFCGMFTGHILALPVFYGVLNGLAMALVFLFDSLCREFLYGFYGVGALYDFAQWFAPVAAILNRINVRANFPGTPDALGGYEPISYTFEGLHIILFYALIGLILAALALVVYRRRQLERAGDIVSVGWVRPVFKYGVGLCFAVVLGTFTYSLLFPYNSRSGWMLVALMLLWGAVGHFVAEMLLHKTFWVFRSGWKGCVVLLACLLAGSSVLMLDLTGYESRLPDAQRVASVELRGLDSYPYDDLSSLNLTYDDPAEIAKALALHQTIIGEQAVYNAYRADTLVQDQPMTQLASGVYAETARTVAVEFFYTLTDGSVFSRRYYVVVTPERLTDPDSAAGQLDALLGDPALVEGQYFRNWRTDHRLVNATLSMVRTKAQEYTEVMVDSDALEPLLEAVRTDLQAGTLGKRYLLEDEARLNTCYVSDLNLTFYVPEGGIDANPNTGVIHYDSDTRTYTVTITLQTTAENTLAVLTESGAVDETHLLLTQTQHQMESNGESYNTPVYYSDDGPRTATAERALQN